MSQEKQGNWLAEIINITLKELNMPVNPKYIVTEHLLKQIWEWLLGSFETPGAHQYLDLSQPLCFGYDMKTLLDLGLGDDFHVVIYGAIACYWSLGMAFDWYVLHL